MAIGIIKGMNSEYTNSIIIKLHSFGMMFLTLSESPVYGVKLLSSLVVLDAKGRKELYSACKETPDAKRFSPV
jgi:hypothetical protein